MGIRGLSRWLAAAGCNQDLSKHSPLSNLKTDHLLVDMNGLLHQAYDAKDPSLNRTIERTLEKVKQVLTKFKPHKSLTLVFDGFAPLAKLQTQKERRAGYAIVETEVGKGNNNNTNNNNVLGRISNSSDTGASDRILCEGEITAGSPYMLMVEDAVINFVTKSLVSGKKEESVEETKNENDTDNEEQNQQVQQKEETSTTTTTTAVTPFALPDDLDIFFSPSTHVGEGEVKISQRLQQLSSSISSSSSDDNIIIFGSDSDLVLVGLLAVKFHNIWVVHPSMGVGTSLGFLLLKWMDSKNVDCLTIDQLPSARIDFVFLMSLAGGDFYTGMDDEAMKLWNRYKQKRSTPHGFSKRIIIFPTLMAATEKQNAAASSDEPQHIIVASAPGNNNINNNNTSAPVYHQNQPRIDAEFFQQVVGGGRNDHEHNHNNNNNHQQKRYQPSKGKTPNQQMKSNINNKKRGQDTASANPGRGATVVSFALWTIEMLMMGRCEALGVAPAQALADAAVPLSSVQAFAKDHNGVGACRPRRSAISGLNATSGLERPPVFTFVAVAARSTYLPIYIRRVLDENPQAKAKLMRPQSTTANIVANTDEVITLAKAHVAGNLNKLYADSPKLMEELQILLLTTPDMTNVGFSLAKNHKNNSGGGGDVAEDNNKNSKKNNNNNHHHHHYQKILVKKTSEELISEMLEIWKFEYPVGNTVRFRGLEKSGKEVIVNVVERKKKSEKKSAKNDDDDDEEQQRQGDDDEEEEEEYED